MMNKAKLLVVAALSAGSIASAQTPIQPGAQKAAKPAPAIPTGGQVIQPKANIPQSTPPAVSTFPYVQILQQNGKAVKGSVATPRAEGEAIVAANPVWKVKAIDPKSYVLTLVAGDSASQSTITMGSSEKKVTESKLKTGDLLQVVKATGKPPAATAAATTPTFYLFIKERKIAAVLTLQK